MCTHITADDSVELLASDEVQDLTSPPKKKHVTRICCVEEKWEEEAIGKRKKANEKLLWEKYKDRLFKDKVKGKIEERIITGIVWNGDEMVYMVMTELIAGGDDCEYCINKMIRNLIYK